MHEEEIAIAQCSCGIEGGGWGAEIVGSEEAIECHAECYP